MREKAFPSRVNLLPSEVGLLFPIKRRQFPIRLAFAMTRPRDNQATCWDTPGAAGVRTLPAIGGAAICTVRDDTSTYFEIFAITSALTVGNGKRRRGQTERWLGLNGARFAKDLKKSVHRDFDAGRFQRTGGKRVDTASEGPTATDATVLGSHTLVGPAGLAAPSKS